MPRVHARERSDRTVIAQARTRALSHNGDLALTPLPSNKVTPELQKHAGYVDLDGADLLAGHRRDLEAKGRSLALGSPTITGVTTAPMGPG